MNHVTTVWENLAWRWYYECSCGIYLRGFSTKADAVEAAEKHREAYTS